MNSREENMNLIHCMQLMNLSYSNQQYNITEISKGMSMDSRAPRTVAENEKKHRRHEQFILNELLIIFSL